jgi:nucleoid-associated protein YgaU
MKTNQKLNLALSLFAAGTLLYGCGAKQVAQTEVPQEPSAAVVSKKISIGHYTVKKHDTLWAIAGKSITYGDSFEWPLIYKANRDKITDPDLIYPNQNFQIEKELPSDDLKAAEKLADETPKYTPHDQPRKKLPVDYF